MTKEEISELQQKDFAPKDKVKVIENVYLNSDGYMKFHIANLCGCVGEVVCHNPYGGIKVAFNVKDVPNCLLSPLHGDNFFVVDLWDAILEKAQ